jgi:hypothetical protein
VEHVDHDESPDKIRLGVGSSGRIRVQLDLDGNHLLVDQSVEYRLHSSIRSSRSAARLSLDSGETPNHFSDCPCAKGYT